VIGIRQGERYDARRIAERHRDHSLFMAFAPADAPRLALAVIVENGGFGAQAAAPIARKVFDYYLLGKLPGDPPGPAAAAAAARAAAGPGGAGTQPEADDEQDLRDVPESIDPEPVSPTEVRRE
jgi:penicillin-binding protein 2